MEPEHRASEKARIAFHERGIEAVRAKMLRVYPPSNGEENLPFAIRDTLSSQLIGARERDYWKQASAKNLAESGLNAQTQPKLDAVAHDIAMRYAESFYIQRYILALKNENVPPRYGNFYRWEKTRGDLIHTAVNHVSNLAEAKLRDIGLKPKNAHAMHGHIIGQIIRTYKAALEFNGMIEYGECAVYPGQGSSRDKSDEDIATEIKQLSSYWKIYKRELQEGYEDFSRHR